MMTQDRDPGLLLLLFVLIKRFDCHHPTLFVLRISDIMATSIKPTAAVQDENKDTSNNESPYDELMKQLKEVQERDSTKIVGSMIIRGCGDDYDSEDDEEAPDPRAYSQKQIDQCRYIIMTKQRDAVMNKMKKLILGANADSEFMMFDTRFSYALMGAYERFQKQYKSTKHWSIKLDLLFGFTDVLKDYDVWVSQSRQMYMMSCIIVCI
jgi:hypothetical protein